MKELLRDSRVRRLLVANTLGSIGSGITIFAVPWLLVHQPGGSEAYRWTTLGTTLTLFAFMPGYGAWLDRHSRKTALLASEVWGFAATTAMAVLGLALGGFATWQLMTIYFFGMCYYTLHYPAKFAFIQQIFDRTQYQSLIGLLEIQGQTAMMLAACGGALLVERVPLWVILLLDAATYALSFFLQSTLPYQATHLKDVSPAATRPGLWHGVAEGWHWLRNRPGLTVFLTGALVPFIVVMVSNYLFPVYVAHTLQAGSLVFGLGEVAFALGAITAGALLPRLLERTDAARTIPGTMLIFIAGMAVIILVPHPWIYLAAGVLIGFGNAGCRVARSSLMLHVVPNAMMGRVSVFYQVFDRLVRTLLVGAMVITDWWGPTAGFMLLFVLALVALAGVYGSRHAARTPGVAAG
ncbi:MAG: MFS transporter [Opitutae bacterium]|nr:MFS transporter [Opitutae bacterium]